MFNPWMRFWFRAGLVPAAFGLVETTGRRSGLARRTPVSGALAGQSYWLVAANGASSYVRNLQAQPRVRVQTGRRWRSGVALCLPEDDPVARRRWISDHTGLLGRLDGLVFSALASGAPLTVRIDLEPP